MTFSEALEVLKRGAHIRRAGWHRDGMRVYMTPAAHYEGVQSGAALVLAITDAQIQPGWIPSVADLFAEDWSVWNDS